MKEIQKQPIYILLLPVFFVIHGVLENIGFVSFTDATALSLTYLIATIIITTLSYLSLRSLTKAALMAALCMAIYCGFGTLHDFLRDNIRLLSKYSILLPALLILLIIAFWRLKKTQHTLPRLTTFLNLLLIIYLLVDITWIVIKTIKPSQDKLSVYKFGKEETFRACDTCAKPDIYFLLFDEYASSTSLKERFQFNNDLDSFLLAKGFSMQTQSRSNYNFTPFSMASILNMGYLGGIKNTLSITAEDYAKCNELIRNNQVIRCLDQQGYEIINYSIFDLAGHPSQVNQSFLPLKTKLITDRTLFARMNRDIGWLLVQYLPFSPSVTMQILKDRNNNNHFIKLTKQAATQKREQPAFIYTHLFMPHVPFYYDRNGQERNTTTLYQEGKAQASPTTYLDYVVYTNTRIKDMVNTIQQQDPAAVIIIMGDHGFRKGKLSPASRHLFTNYNAVYIPARNKTAFTPALTGVNQFRILFNELFAQNLPLQKDTCIYLQDKQ